MSKALKVAIEANDPEAVRQALKGIKDINRKIPDANKPLLYACEKGADKVLEVLFEAGAIGEKQDMFLGDAPFAVAAKFEQEKVLRHLWSLKQTSCDAVDHAISEALGGGKTTALELILKIANPPIGVGYFRLACVYAQTALSLLVKYRDVSATHDSIDGKGSTLLHEVVRTGRLDLIRAVIRRGANLNARDSLGKTPLMVLASILEDMESWFLSPKSFEENLDVSGSNKIQDVVDGKRAVQTLLESGADATLADYSSNDAIDYYVFHCLDNKRTPKLGVIEILQKAGAKGSEPTHNLFRAISQKNLEFGRDAISRGADVNRLAPASSPRTPLVYAATSSPVEFINLLLKAGADPNKYAGCLTPLIRAARCGNFAAVKELIVAGADINAIETYDEFPCNAYTAATANGKHEIAEYLKSIGARRPKPTIIKLFKPGVESWNDFGELLVKSTVVKAAEALAKIVNGKVQLDVYGQSLLPGKQAYVVARPKGMNWCNVFQIAPPRLRYEDSSKAEALARELAKVSGASVLSIEYSDTSDAASVFRVEPDGESSQDAGWDRDTLEEMVGAMGDEAPEWAKKQLAKPDEDEPSSTERLEMLAGQEKFVVAAFGLDCEPGRKLDVDFTGYGAEAFDGVAFVSI